MEQNLYIPGDLVMTDPKYNCQYPKGLICEFVGYDLSHKGKCVMKIKDTGERLWLEEENIAPIKLVSDVLKKNGWKFTNIGTSLYQYYKDDIYIKYDKLEEKFKFDDLYWSAYSFEIPYVHTLQHLLFGLGLKSEMEV